MCVHASVASLPETAAGGAVQLGMPKGGCLRLGRESGQVQSGSSARWQRQQRVCLDGADSMTCRTLSLKDLPLGPVSQSPPKHTKSRASGSQLYCWESQGGAPINVAGWSQRCLSVGMRNAVHRRCWCAKRLLSRCTAQCDKQPCATTLFIKEVRGPAGGLPSDQQVDTPASLSVLPRAAEVAPHRQPQPALTAGA